MPIKSFDRDGVKHLRSQLEAELAAIAARLGVNIKVGNANFSSTNVEFKVAISVISDGGVVESAERSAYKRNCLIYGLQPEWLDKEISFQGRRYKIIGLLPKSHTYPVLVEYGGGKRIKLKSSTVRDYFSRYAVPAPVAAPAFNRPAPVERSAASITDLLGQAAAQIHTAETQ